MSLFVFFFFSFSLKYYLISLTICRIGYLELCYLITIVLEIYFRCVVVIVCYLLLAKFHCGQINILYDF